MSCSVWGLQRGPGLRTVVAGSGAEAEAGGEGVNGSPLYYFPCFGGDSIVWGWGLGAEACEMVVVGGGGRGTPDPLKGHRVAPGAKPHSWFGDLGRREPVYTQAQVGTQRGRCDPGDRPPHGHPYTRAPIPHRRAPGHPGAQQAQAGHAQKRTRRHRGARTQRGTAARRHSSPEGSRTLTRTRTRRAGRPRRAPLPSCR